MLFAFGAYDNHKQHRSGGDKTSRNLQQPAQTASGKHSAALDRARLGVVFYHHPFTGSKVACRADTNDRLPGTMESAVMVMTLARRSQHGSEVGCSQ